MTKTTTKKPAASTESKEAAKATAEQKVTAASAIGANVTESEIAAARKEGAIEAEKKAAKDSYKYVTDGNLVGEEPTGPQYPNASDVMQYEPLLHLDLDAFEAALAEDAPSPVPEEKAYGLLGLERNGQNRTQYVQALMKRCNLKAGDPLPGGGPGYTNDVRPISKL